MRLIFICHFFCRGLLSDPVWPIAFVWKAAYSGKDQMSPSKSQRVDLESFCIRDRDPLDPRSVVSCSLFEVLGKRGSALVQSSGYEQ
jgi:hypothetical protein